MRQRKLYFCQWEEGLNKIDSLMEELIRFNDIMQGGCVDKKNDGIIDSGSRVRIDLKWVGKRL